MCSDKSTPTEILLESQTGLLPSTAVRIGYFKIVFKPTCCTFHGNINLIDVNTTEVLSNLKVCMHRLFVSLTLTRPSISNLSSSLPFLHWFTEYILTSSQMFCLCNSRLISTHKYFKDNKLNSLCILWNIYLCWLILNCTAKHLIATTNNSHQPKMQEEIIYMIIWCDVHVSLPINVSMNYKEQVIYPSSRISSAVNRIIHQLC